MFLSEVSFLDNILINKRKKYRGSNRMEDERGERQKGRESIISPTHSLDIVHIVPWTLLYCLYTLRISIFSSFSGNGTGQPQQMPGKGVKQTFKPRSPDSLVFLLFNLSDVTPAIEPVFVSQVQIVLFSEYM